MGEKRSSSEKIVKYSISNRKFDSQKLENVIYLACVAEGREEVTRRKVIEVMREREGDFRGKEKRIQIVSITQAINKKVPNEIGLGLYKYNKVWIKIIQKKEMYNEPGRLPFNLNDVNSD